MEALQASLKMRLGAKTHTGPVHLAEARQVGDLATLTTEQQLLEASYTQPIPAPMNGALSDVAIALLTRNPDLKCILLTLPTEDYKELARSSLKPASKPKHSSKSKTESILLDYTKVCTYY